jgi:hypothetical protein
MANFRCELCNTNYKTRGGLTRHTVKKHTGSPHNEMSVLPVPQPAPVHNVIVTQPIRQVETPVGQPAIQDIQTFFTISARGDNDASNKLRERILSMLSNIPPAYTSDPTYGPNWCSLRDKWNAILRTIATETAVPTYTTYDVQVKGGRGFHYDFLIVFYNGSTRVAERKIEFKYGGRTIQEIPQFLSLQVRNDTLIPFVDYATYYYDVYLDRYLETDNGITEPKPSKEEWLRCVINTKYSVRRFFQQLKEREDVYKVRKSRIVNESIKKYLETYGNSVNIHYFAEKVKETQKEKIYVLWSNGQFYIDRITPSELDLTTFETIRNENTIVLRSGSCTTTFHLLLRWRNHKGILNPAWQIKMKRE